MLCLDTHRFYRKHGAVQHWYPDSRWECPPRTVVLETGDSERFLCIAPIVGNIEEYGKLQKSGCPRQPSIQEPHTVTISLTSRVLMILGRHTQSRDSGSALWSFCCGDVQPQYPSVRRLGSKFCVEKHLTSWKGLPLVVSTGLLLQEYQLDRHNGLGLGAERCGIVGSTPAQPYS